MKKSILIIAIIGLAMNFSFAQKFLCRDGHVWFFGTTPMENIEAHNKQASSIINTETGEIVVSVLMKSFEFEKALMQEHFNENYVESDKFPKGKFNGKITNLNEIDFSKPGSYTAQVKGVLNIHGVDKEYEIPVEMRVDGETINAQGKFATSAEDFKIEIPSVVRDKIAKQIDVNLNMSFSPYKK
ncbi:MAG: YceI family protein [Bacteroidales bacterium]|nr:YceI family protein [Bacteroidales bacterium]MCF8458999.1 YceI family protein [Bacteroidales bacterium]